MKNIAVIFGGASCEYDISLKSAYSVLKYMNCQKYNIIKIGIKKDGGWYLYQGDIEDINNDTWHLGNKNIQDICINLSSSDRGFYIKGSNEKILIDKALVIMHGKNGEDGTVQGILELLNIEIIGCKLLSSAICMQKDLAHKIIQAEGIKVPKSLSFKKSEIGEAEKIISQNLNFPVFIKPIKCGSSIGISKIYSIADLKEAMLKAFYYDDEVTVEENIEGFEVGCAVLGMDEIITGRVDEIELNVDFFDFDEKYMRKSSFIHTPARISEELEEKIKDAAIKIYKALKCSGFARVDMFLQEDGEIVFNEVNTIPGLTDKSRFPIMLKEAGISFENFIRILEELYDGNKN